MTQEQDYKRFSELMDETAQLTAMPANKNLGKATHLLFKELQKYPWEIVREAVIYHRQHENFFPTLADIVKSIEGGTEERALLSWMLVKKAEKKYGLSKSFRFPQPAIQFAIDALGGWRKLYYDIGGDDERFIQHEFTRFYEIAERRGVTWNDIDAPYFKGDIELTARKLGKEKLPPVYDVGTGNELVKNDLPALGATA